MLLDTCTFLWLVAEPKRLSARVRKKIDALRGELFLSEVSALEICLKWNARKIVLPMPPRRWIEEQIGIWALSALPLSRTHMYRATELPRLHDDPFDRLLVAQALESDLAIVTPDEHVARYPVAVVW